ncbi:hypothetical protein, partial [Klebsiella pneumoniae]|uniref:hypothetical protein n=1 Tax=Klebsiella pneumoniae TaxID=573 RepID=UPI002730F8A1
MPNLSLTWGKTPIIPISVVMIPNTPNARTGINNFDFTTHSILNNEESEDDFTTFADLAAGGAIQWFFEIEAVSDFGT